jgi:hypothetical protein
VKEETDGRTDSEMQLDNRIPNKEQYTFAGEESSVSYDKIINMNMHIMKEINTQRYWVFGLCPSSGFFLNNNEKTQRFGNWICLRPQVREHTY